MTLNGRTALCFTNDASFRAHHKNLKEDRPILSAAGTVLLGGIRLVRIFMGGPWRGVLKQQWGGSELAIFGNFGRRIF